MIGSLNLPCLEEINLSNNKIEDISAMADWKCPNLKKINLEYGKFRKIGSLNLPCLEEIIISIYYFEGDILTIVSGWKCPNLKRLSLRYGIIEKFENLELPCIEEINFKFSFIKDFSATAVWKCPNLKKI